MPNAMNGTTYIITYELGEKADTSNLVATIMSYGTWAKITENSWAIVAIGQKSKDIRDKLLPMIGKNGRLFVIKSGYESAWSNVQAKTEWFKKYLEN